MLKRLAVSIMLALSVQAFAAETYDPAKSYSTGQQVSFNGNIYETQWWANPGDSPASVTPNSWESPWILVAQGGGTVPKPDPAPKPDPTPEPEGPPLQGNYPAYKEGTAYKAGDIVAVSSQLYRCKSGVTSAWCSGASWAYAPGSGTAWADAWEKVSEGEAVNPAPDPTPTPTPPPSVGGDAGGSAGGEFGPGGTTSPDGKYYIPRSVIDAKEVDLTTFPMMEIVKNDIRTLPNDQVEAIVALSETNPDNVKRIESIMPEKDWNEVLFPKRAPEYTYLNFLKAAGKFPALCQTYTDGRDSDAICRKTLATMFAHFAQETGGHNAYWDEPEWRQGLVYVREMGWNEDGRDGYNAECSQPETWQAKKWPCGKFENGDFKSYFGRGAKQLSYSFNYGPFSEAIYGDVSVLLEKPETVADTWLNLASAIFFFVYPQPPKPSMLNVINGTWLPNERDLANGLVPGFGVTTQIINGGVECGGSVEVAQSRNRISYYRKFAEHFGVPILDDEVLGCASMKSFDEYGSGAVNIYWTEDWSWGGTSTPDEKSYACQLVRYQTAYSAFVKGDYAKCVQETFPKAVIVEDK